MAVAPRYRVSDGKPMFTAGGLPMICDEGDDCCGEAECHVDAYVDCTDEEWFNVPDAVTVIFPTMVNFPGEPTCSGKSCPNYSGLSIECPWIDCEPGTLTYASAWLPIGLYGKPYSRVVVTLIQPGPVYLTQVGLQVADDAIGTGATGGNVTLYTGGTTAVEGLLDCIIGMVTWASGCCVNEDPIQVVMGVF